MSPVSFLPFSTVGPRRSTPVFPLSCGPEPLEYHVTLLFALLPGVLFSSLGPSLPPNVRPPSRPYASARSDDVDGGETHPRTE